MVDFNTEPFKTFTQQRITGAPWSDKAVSFENLHGNTRFLLEAVMVAGELQPDMARKAQKIEKALADNYEMVVNAAEGKPIDMGKLKQVAITYRTCAHDLALLAEKWEEVKESVLTHPELDTILQKRGRRDAEGWASKHQKHDFGIAVHTLTTHMPQDRIARKSKIEEVRDASVEQHTVDLVRDHSRYLENISDQLPRAADLIAGLAAKYDQDISLSLPKVGISNASGKPGTLGR